MKRNTLVILILFVTTSFSIAQENTYRNYLYKDQWLIGKPSGFYGQKNGSGMKIIPNYDKNVLAGTKCIRIKADGTEAWSGFLNLSAGKWLTELKNDKSELTDLSNYDSLIIHIRAEKKTRINLGIGENSESNTAIKDISISTNWQKISIPITKLDRSALNGLFNITLLGADTIYLDEIYFVAKKGFTPKETKVETKNTIPLKPIKVSMQKKANGSFVLLRGGKPYYVKGAGGQVYLDRIKKYGGNSIRTWGHEGAKAVLDSAHKYGLTVMMGLWVQHERHGFNYDDKDAVYYQLQQFKDVVLELKDHPALLCWGIGNEVDLFYKNTNVWFAIQDIAKMVHELDPNHPTTTVTAGLDPLEITLINERCPDIDIMSINTYGDLENVVPEGIRKANWKGAYMITEWGPTGHWEISNTDFKIPVEQTSTEKGVVYRNRYKTIAADTSKCIGSYVFLWGNKQETTPTWYSMFLKDGSESEILDVMEYNWSGKWPKNKAPSINGLTINGKKALDNVYVKPGAKATAQAILKDPENKTLKIEWVFMPESTDKKSGGDFELTPEPVQNLITEDLGSTINFTVPAKVGAYRLFIYAYDDDKNVAYGNIPFFVKE